MKIMLMGPSWRNQNLALWLTARGHSVLMDDGRKEDRYFSQINPDYIISNGYGPIFSKVRLPELLRVSLTYTRLRCHGSRHIPQRLGAIRRPPNRVSVHLIDPA